jgi:adenine-specific DNA-methyltransferase
VDFEKRIANIYQQCRKTEEIKSAFDRLQLELNFEINEAMTQTRRKLLEHFDDELITQIDDKLIQRTKTEQLFTIQWRLA